MAQGFSRKNSEFGKWLYLLKTLAGLRKSMGNDSWISLTRGSFANLSVCLFPDSQSTLIERLGFIEFTLGEMESSESFQTIG